MKKLKKLSALLMASVITAGTVSVTSVGAMYTAKRYDDLDNFLEDFFVIPKCDGELYSESLATNNKETTFYISKDKHNLLMEIYDAKSSYLNMSINADADLDAVEKIFEDICSDAEVSISSSDTNGRLAIKVSGFSGKLPYEEARQKNISLEQAREIHDKLAEIASIDNFYYRNSAVEYKEHNNYLTNYCDTTGYDKEKIETYITENNLKFHIEYFDGEDSSTFKIFSSFLVVPDEEISTTEHYNLANEIYKSTGIFPFIMYNESTDSTVDVTIDLHNNIDGDANDDGELALSDAVAIMQSIGNPDEYQLTPQGEFNADITGNYDGITNKDALTIQRRLLGLE